MDDLRDSEIAVFDERGGRECAGLGDGESRILSLRQEEVRRVSVFGVLEWRSSCR